MSEVEASPWLVALRTNVDAYHRMIEAATAQLSDQELGRRPAEGFNSVAVLLQHLAGNLRSRWTDYLTTDGEKPWRDREAEFADWDGDRQVLWERFEAGWAALTAALDTLEPQHVDTLIYIRGEPQTVAQALVRSLCHIAYHAGQICWVARLVHEGEWRWLTIAPGASQAHNQRTWGTADSRSIFGQAENSEPEER